RLAMSARACSRANSVFFEPQALAPQELPHRILGDLPPTRRKVVLQPIPAQMRRLMDPLHDECPVRLQDTLAVPAHLARRHRPAPPATPPPPPRRRNYHPHTS